jgi:uncharacterized protein
MDNVIIVHGANENKASAYKGGRENTRHWHPWLKKILEEKGIKVSGELYPRDWNPSYKEWKEVFEKNPISEETILIGHSAGCAFILRWISETKRRVQKIILVAPYILKTKEFPLFNPLTDFKIGNEIEKYCNEIVTIYSKNDYYFILQSVKFLRSAIEARFIEYLKAGHFCTSNGFKEFPELLDEILR